MQPQVTLERDGCGGRLLHNVRRNIDQRGTAFGNERRRELSSRTIGHIKCATVCVENARRALDDEPVQFMRSNGFAKGFAEPVQKIENKCFLDLNFLMRAFQRANPLPLGVGSKNPPGHRREKQSEEKGRPHEQGPAYFEGVS